MLLHIPKRDTPAQFGWEPKSSLQREDMVGVSYRGAVIWKESALMMFSLLKGL